MYILLTDISSCPKCGPEHGLILLVEDVQGRQVRRGALACASCRAHYPIVDGVADLRAGGAAAHGAPIPEAAALRLVALAGVTEAPARLLLVGPIAAHLRAAAALLPGVQVVAAAGELEADAADAAPGTSRLLISDRLPFYDRRFSGVVLSGDAVEALLPESVRVLGPAGRLVLEPVSDAATERLAGEGLRVLAREGATVVAVRS